jgi:hypothetical protein
MKTNVDMFRKMGQFDVVQRISDGKFNASNLLKQWNTASGSNKKITNFIALSQTKEFIDELIKDTESHGQISYLGESQAVMVKKGRNTKKGKTADVVWYHPFLFLKFAMWLNPRFELHVIKFVYDQLIDYRHEAGDNYSGLTNSIQQFKGADYRRMAKGLNWIVFNRHERGIRNTATAEQLKNLVDLQKQLAFSVDMGYIETFDSLIAEMIKIYRSKWNSF